MIYIGQTKKKSSTLLGIVILILGLIIFNNPFGTLEFLAAVMAWGILIWGIINLISFRYFNINTIGNNWLLSQGILNILFAIIILMSLSMAVKTIMLVFGIYVIITSILKLTQGFKLKKYNIVNWQITILFGLIGMLFGICLLLFPEIVPIMLSLFLITIGSIIILNSIKNN